jgi:hypothetical protein
MTRRIRPKRQYRVNKHNDYNEDRFLPTPKVKSGLPHTCRWINIRNAVSKPYFTQIIWVERLNSLGNN